MNIELINWEPETKGRIIKIDYKINEHFRSMRVCDHQVKNVMLDYFSKDGISQNNVHDFINGVDVKYKIEEYHKLFFIQYFHTVSK